MEPTEKSPLLNHTPTASINRPGGTQLYLRRWYMLFVFSALALLQSMTWNTWGPIADTARAVYGWSQSDVALLSNWGPITYIVSAFFFSWLMESKGLRISVLVSGGCMLLGTILRCLPIPPQEIIWVMHVGQLFIGLSGPIMMSAPTVLSAAWFPPNQRTFSTAVGAMSGIVGVALSFLVGSLMVTDIEPNDHSTTVVPVPAVTTAATVTNQSFQLHDDLTTDGIHKHRLEISHLMYLECGISLVFYVAAVLYFPSKPPTPPSTTGSVERENFLTGFKALCTKWQFMAPALAYGVFTGIYGGWTTEMTSILDSIGVHQSAAGWMGFCANIAGVIGGLLISGLVDITGGKNMKLVLLILTLMSVGVWVWIVLICGDYIHYHSSHVWISYIATGFFVASLIPIFYEICAEGAYPIGESSTTGLMTWLNNAACLLFLLVASIKSFGYAWMNWTMLGSVFLVVPLLLFYKEHYNRLDVDIAGSSNQRTSDCA